MKKAIATPPGQPTQYVDLNEQELQQIEVDKEHNRVRIIEALTPKIKNLASQKILDIVPDWKQRNMLEDSISIIRANGAKTTVQEARIQVYDAEWKRVKDIRKYSDKLEEKIDKAIANGEDPTLIDIESGWPT